MKRLFKWIFLILGILILLVNLPLIFGAFIHLFATDTEKAPLVGELAAYIIIPAIFFFGYFVLRKK